MSLFVRPLQATYTACAFSTLWVAFFHSTPCQLGGGPRTQPRKEKYKAKTPSSSRKLAKSLGPKSGRPEPFQVVPREKKGNKLSSRTPPPLSLHDAAPASPFVRDAAPHLSRSGAPRLSSSKQKQDGFLLRPQKRRLSPRKTPRVEEQYPKRGTSSGPTAKNLSSEVLDTPNDQSQHSSKPAPHPNRLIDRFTSPPLLPGLLESIEQFLGPESHPTHIQALSINHFFGNKEQVAMIAPPACGGKWRQCLLASETGSGKSIAYLLPMLQSLKQSELHPELSYSPPHSSSPQRALNPRGLILAPTHELARQLASFAKGLLHNIKLRVMCMSRANARNDDAPAALSSSKMAHRLADEEMELDAHTSAREHDVDIVVGTPNKLLEMVRGFRWADSQDDGQTSASARKSKVVMGLSRVEWVAIDEADVLFDPDFIDTTKLLLTDVTDARRFDASVSQASAVTSVASTSPHSRPTEARDINPDSYPFNLIISSATIPSSLAAYLDKHHPNLSRLLSPGLHKLPRGLVTEYVPWSGGNRWSDVEKRIRQVWAEEASGGHDVEGVRSKVLIFCNKGTTVEDLGEYLDGKGVKNIALRSHGKMRKRGNNHHLDGFLKVPKAKANRTTPASTTTTTPPDDSNDAPQVLITTSLLSRGLDFSPSVRYVLIPEPPRNTIDFLHRAGRSGRAGEWGRVVVFVKAKGRGSGRDQEVRKTIGALAARPGGKQKSAGVQLLQPAWGGHETTPPEQIEGSVRGMEYASGRDGRKAAHKNQAEYKDSRGVGTASFAEI